MEPRSLGKENTGWSQVGSLWRGNHGGLRRLREAATCRERLLEHTNNKCQYCSHGVGGVGTKLRSYSKALGRGHKSLLTSQW